MAILVLILFACAAYAQTKAAQPAFVIEGDHFVLKGKPFLPTPILDARINDSTGSKQE
jgi:hypothetical protein